MPYKSKARRTLEELLEQATEPNTKADFASRLGKLAERESSQAARRARQRRKAAKPTPAKGEPRTLTEAELNEEYEVFILDDRTPEQIAEQERANAELAAQHAAQAAKYRAVEAAEQEARAAKEREDAARLERMREMAPPDVTVLPRRPLDAFNPFEAGVGTSVGSFTGGAFTEAPYSETTTWLHSNAHGMVEGTENWDGSLSPREADPRDLPDRLPGEDFQAWGRRLNKLRRDDE